MDDDIDGGTVGDDGGGRGSLAGWSDDELTVGYDAALAGCRRAGWDRLVLEAEIDRRRMFVGDGVGSLREWIAIRTGEGERSAFFQARVARALRGFPELGAALADGRLSVAHVGLLVTLAGLAGVEDAELVGLGERHTVPQLEAACRAARAVSARADRDGHARRHLRWRYDDNGTVHLHGRLQGPDGLTVTNLLAAMAEADGDDGEGGSGVGGERDPFDARCADALVEVCSGRDPSRPERAEVVVHVPLSALRPTPTDPPDLDPDADGDADPDPYRLDRSHLDRCCLGGCRLGGSRGDGPGPAGGPGTVRTWDGTVISTPAFQRLLCDSRLRLTIDGPDGQAVGIGHRSRNVPAWLAQQVRWRDQHCRFPGCEATHWLHSHHLHHWPYGPTDLLNLVTLCGRHHRAVHEGPWRVHGNPNGPLTFTGPHHQTHITRPAVPMPVPTPSRRRPRPGSTRPEPPPGTDP